jgi:1-acylglycerone phosphate reductase
MLTPQKSVLITGCSKGGIGDALCQEYHKRGLRVFATARNMAKIKHLGDMGIETVQLDVESSESIKAVAEKVTERTGGKLDILVNNSGIGTCIHLCIGDS